MQLVAQGAKDGGANYLEVFVVSLAATQERQGGEVFVEQVRTSEYQVTMDQRSGRLSADLWEQPEGDF